MGPVRPLCAAGLIRVLSAPTSDQSARAIGYPSSPVDDLLLFHVVFGKTVPDISLNAIANLGYAEGRFSKPAYPGDTLDRVRSHWSQGEFQQRDGHGLCPFDAGRNQRGEVVPSTFAG